MDFINCFFAMSSKILKENSFMAEYNLNDSLVRTQANTM